MGKKEGKKLDKNSILSVRTCSVFCLLYEENDPRSILQHMQNVRFTYINIYRIKCKRLNKYTSTESKYLGIKN